MKRVKLNPAERQVARIYQRQASELLTREMGRAAQIVAAAQAKVQDYEKTIQDELRILLVLRGVPIAPTDKLVPQLDPKAKVVGWVHYGVSGDTSSRVPPPPLSSLRKERREDVSPSKGDTVSPVQNSPQEVVKRPSACQDMNCGR